MKRLFSVALVLGLGLLLVSGCQQATTTESASIPAETVAADVGTMAKNSLAIDNGVLGVVTSLSLAGVKASAPSTPTYGADGWWTSTDNYSSASISYDISYKWKIWNTGDQEIITLQDLQNVSSSTDISKLWTYTTISYTLSSGSYTITYGASTGSPLKFEGYNASETISGPISFSSTYSGDTYSVTYTYGSLSVSGGYPSGAVSWSVSSNGSEVYAGTVTFNGTNTATLTFTAGASGTYSVNLDSGVVTPASVN